MKSARVSKRAPPRNVVRQLAASFRRNGYMRLPNAERRVDEPHEYKKGYEIRLVADSLVELRTIRRLLRAAGFKPPAAFAKARQWRQPIYGREAVGRFLDLIGKK
jgi:hypothetical protein